MKPDSQVKKNRLPSTWSWKRPLTQEKPI